MFDLIFLTLFLFIPAYIANMMPMFFLKIRALHFLKIPLDGGKSLIKYRILGDHKTVLGFLAGCLGGIIGGFVQFLIHSVFMYPPPFSLIVFDFFQLSLFYGFLAGLGALLGDMVKSFIKRRFAIESGKPFPPFDQIDFILGAYVFISIYFKMASEVLLTALLITIPLHFLANIIAYRLGLKKVWW